MKNSGGVDLPWITALLIWAVSSALAILHYPPQQVGDGREYSLLTLSLKRDLNPTVTLQDFETWNQLAADRPWFGYDTWQPPSAMASVDPFLRLPGPGEPRWDLRHFWTYSLLALPFAWLTDLLNLHPLVAFSFLHSALLLLALALARRWSGGTGALAATVLMFCSPYWWLANKAHTEILTGTSLLLAVIGIARARYATAGVWLALGASQNALLTPFSLLALLLGWRALRVGDVYSRFMTLTACALLALSPAYYLLRHGVLSPLSLFGYALPQLIGWKRVATLWVDPDRGLLLLWPLALPLLAISAWLAMKTVRVSGWRALVTPFSLFATLYFVGCHLGLAMQANWNHAGSYLVHRYALWFVPFGWPALAYWLGSHQEAPRRRPRLPATALLVGLSAWSWLAYSPRNTDDMLQTNAVSRWVYSTIPGLWNPDPEVFIEKNCGEEIYGYKSPLRRVRRRRWTCQGLGAEKHHIWAVADRSCRKLYVSSEGLAAKVARPDIGLVVGCPLVADESFLRTHVLPRAPADGRDFYVTLERGDVRLAPPLVPTGEPVLLGAPEAARYFGFGWSDPEGWGRWSDGGTARLFAGLPAPGGRHWRLLVEADGFIPEGSSGGQSVLIVVNGKRAGRVTWAGREARTFEIPNPSNEDALVIDLQPSVLHDPTSPKPLDSRRLGVAVRRMWLETRGAGTAKQ